MLKAPKHLPVPIYSSSVGSDLTRGRPFTEDVRVPNSKLHSLTSPDLFWRY